MDELVNAVAAPTSSRGRERMARILDAATELFLKDGYGATSIDAILEVSGGSKATLYTYFPTKDDLFRAVIDHVLAGTEQPRLDTHGDVKTTLTEFAVRRLGVVFSEQHQALLRLIIAERERFPDLARMYYERGPLRSRRVLVEYLGRLERQGMLDPGSAEEAAEFLIGTLAHRWTIQVLLLGEGPALEDVEERASCVVDRFLTGYLRQGGSPGVGAPSSQAMPSL